MSEFDDAVRFMVDKLNIEISQDTVFGPVERISIKLKIGDIVISEDSYPLPNIGGMEENLLCCQGVDGPCGEPATLRRQSTRYNDEQKNWVKMCDGCFEHNQKHWTDMWSEYNGSRFYL